jgi:parallel beta-helix repeat protein
MENRRGIQLEGYLNSNNFISENNVESNRMNGIWLGSASNNTIIRNNITANGLFPEWKEGGILLYCSFNSSVIENNIQFNYEYGIKMVDSAVNTIIENNVTHNVNFGILLEGSQGNLISQNKIIENFRHGLLIRYCYGSNTLRYNDLVGNQYNFGVEGYMDRYVHDVDETNTVNGKPIYYWVNRENDQIPLDAGYVAIVNSTNIKVKGLNLKNNYQGILIAYSNNIIINQNNIMSNRYGIWLSYSSSNFIYHNNFVNNAVHVYGYPSTNVWDNDYPSGGNFWSDYTSVDLYSGSYQNETGSDGVADAAYIIDASNTDRYPLMGPINIFDAGVWNETEYFVDIMSNSTVSDFYFNPDEGAFLKFNVTGDDGTVGFCRVSIPNDLLWVDDGWTISVGDQLITNYTLIPNGNYTYLYFTYNHSTQTVTIQGTDAIPEFPSTIMLLTFLILITIPLIFTKKKQHKRKANNRR